MHLQLFGSIQKMSLSCFKVADDCDAIIEIMYSGDTLAKGQLSTEDRII